jgi:NADH-quinone oxidoreductase subunit L
LINEAAVWAIIGLPLLGGLVNIGLIRPWFPRLWPYTGLVSVVTIGAAFWLSVWALSSVLGHHGEAIGFAPREWMAVGDVDGGTGFHLTIGVLLDPLSAIMATVVTGVSMLVQLYSLGYMRKLPHDEGGEWVDYPRYFAYMSMFTASMLGLVLAYNLIQTFVFWELVGLFSYLLIGFWFHRPAAAAAAKKAFIVTRLGDFGFLLALMWLFSHRAQFTQLGLNPFEIPDINEAAIAMVLTPALVTWAALGLFSGAVGKSAQFPLHTWLPDAMEGPTPVSSLIHAATMVAAGVFLVARVFPLFEATSAVLNTVAIIGGVTAVMAAAMGLVATDIKRVLAFSTISQLGYMFIALGVGAPVVAMFHLFNHAFFKCLLFLSAGSVHHSVHTFDMRYMGGIRAWMPITYVLTVLAGLSLAGIWPLSGFWSKDEILAAAFYAEADAPGSPAIGMLVFWLALAGSAMTAFYTFRLILMTFHGAFRGGIDSVPMEERIPDEAHHHVHKVESPWIMIAPMLVLGVLSVGSAIVANSTFDLGPIPAHWFAELFGEEAEEIVLWIAAVSMLVALAGIGLAIAIYGVRRVSLDNLPTPVQRLRWLLEQRLLMDHLYEYVVVRRFLYRGVFYVSDWLDKRIVDGAADFVGWTGRNAGRFVAQLQTGQVQAYGVAVSVGVVVLLWAFLVRT